MDASVVQSTLSRTQVASQEIVKETAQWIPRFGIGFLIILAFLVATSLLSKILERTIPHASPSRKTIMILLYHTFQVGDHITTSGFEGVVSNIDLRYTIINADSKRILIPNSMLVTNPIVIREEAKISKQ